ncbi:S-adenosyl-L-methionine-dependent methyltransferase, partial [Corynascus similis CBS 632.67]
MLRAFCTAAQELEIYDDYLLQSPSLEECLDHKFQLEAALEEGASEIIDLTGEDGSQEVSSRQATVLGDEAQEYSSYELPNGILLEPGKTIQLKQPVGAFQIEFVRIKAIWRPAWELDVRIRGLGFSRNENLNGMLPCWLNEVTMVAEFHNPNAIQWEQHSLLDIKVCDILCVRELRITNAPFPEHSSRASCQTSLGRRLLQETQGPLVCRFRFQIQYLSDHNTVPFERALIKINEEEADTDYRILDSVNLNRWRGGKVPGGSYRPGGPSDPIFDLEQSEPEPPHLMPRQRYTAGDVFSGAGGAARGMERAGVKLEFVVDNWSHAIESLRSNFPKTRVHGMSVADYCASEETKCKVDLMHLSPPCQYFSPAHTIRGKDDETNIKAFLTCPRIVERNKPRIFTMEETFGLLLDTHQVHLHKLICGFVELGYSMRWRCVRLSSWGVPQTRQRFLMIGSAPGEKLPPFPPYTHSKDGNGGLQPWVTPQSALAAISPTIENELHRLEPDKHFKHPRERWDPTTLAKTITCSGGQNYHWSGERDFTLLEYAVLQGFPTWHRFKGKCIKKQIGNAFSPTVVKVFYEHLINWLLAQDGFDPAAVRQEYAREGMPSDLTADNYICLDDIDETSQT